MAQVEDGVVLLDDTVPDDELSALPDQHQSAARRGSATAAGLRWHGDVWKVVAALHRHHPELSYRTITTGENAQTVGWWGSSDRRLSTPAQADLMAIDALSYDEELGLGLPDWFLPLDEEAAIRSALDGVRHR